MAENLKKMAHVIQKSVATGNGTTVEDRKAQVCVPVTYVVSFAMLFVATVVVACFSVYKLRKVKSPNNETRVRLNGTTLSSHMENSVTDQPELSYSRHPRGEATPAAGDSNDNDSIYSTINSYASINELYSIGKLLRRNSTNDDESYMNSELASDWNANDPARSDIPHPPPPPPAPKCPPRALKPLRAKFSEPLPLPPSELPTVFDLEAASSSVEREGGTLRNALRTHRIFRSRIIDSSLESLVD